MPAGLEQFLDDVFANLATRLLWVLGQNLVLRASLCTGTTGKNYADDRNVLDMVLEARRLVAGILLRHRFAVNEDQQ